MTTAGIRRPSHAGLRTSSPIPLSCRPNLDGRPDLERSPFRISTFDENALEAALQLAPSTRSRCRERFVPSCRPRTSCSRPSPWA